MILFILGLIETLLLTIFTLSVVDDRPNVASLIQMACFASWAIALRYIAIEPNNWNLIILYVLGSGVGTRVAFDIVHSLKKKKSTPRL